MAERVRRLIPSVFFFFFFFSSRRRHTRFDCDWFRRVLFRSNGLKVVLKNRNIKLPYQDWAVFVIQEWKKIGVEAEHRPLETAAWFADGQNTGNLDLIVSRPVRFMYDPDAWVNCFTTGDTENWGLFSDPRFDDLFSRQTREIDPVERKKL